MHKPFIHKLGILNKISYVNLPSYSYGGSRQQTDNGIDMIYIGADKTITNIAGYNVSSHLWQEYSNSQVIHRNGGFQYYNKYLYLFGGVNSESTKISLDNAKKCKKKINASKQGKKVFLYRGKNGIFKFTG